MRWALLTQDYNPVIKHNKGADNVVADELSCIQQSADDYLIVLPHYLYLLGHICFPSKT